MHAYQIPLEEAENIYYGMPDSCQLPTLHPLYVAADASRDDRLQPIFWYSHENNGKFLYSFHLCETKLEKNLIIRDIESPYGYGSPLTNTRDSSFLEGVRREFQNWAQANKILAHFARIHPLANHPTHFYEKVDFNRSTVFINLKGHLFDDYSGRRRTYIRRESEKIHELVKVEDANNFSAFIKLYEETMRRASARDFYFFKEKYYENLYKLSFVECWLLHDEHSIVAGALILVSHASKIIEYHLGAHTIRSKSRPMIYLLHLLARHYQKEGFEIFYLGGGRSTSKDDSLLLFKRGFSSNLIPFNIGFSIYNHDHYESLKSLRPGQDTTILFYRD
ncbi:hypothetical protein ThidrDRAFT_4211 [Thiorhodococcus drewsii AZ1]|uniref:BioF2-like acetyltransferase domain-containing protein n=2 Tax=Thiorhodococcus drewsii TaxID=210408 RepID=G2E7E8_9GAMM|nr:hypothetical protein ThidrDRAFT_4211 [Thiorhodococcus drewsii AZ1]